MPAAGDIISIDDILQPKFVGLLSGTIANNSVTTLTPASALVNVGAMWSSGTNIVIPAGMDGEFELGIVLRYASQAAVVGFRQCRIVVNGAELMQWNVAPTTALNNTNTMAWGSIRTVLDAGDVVTFAAYQNSGGSLALTGSSTCCVERVIQ